MTRVDDGQRREEEARRLCEQAEAAVAARDYARARSLLERAKADYPGTTCANSADARLEQLAVLETIAERVHFEFNRAQITDAAAAVLQRKADVLKRYPEMQIVIEGHCDERGSLEYNQALGMRRAQATLQYLLTLGVSETMFRPVTFGEERPLVPRSDEQSWSQNRRAEFVVRNPNAS
jgi:peptidoglycan-associated lipoprotein